MESRTTVWVAVLILVLVAGASLAQDEADECIDASSEECQIQMREGSPVKKQVEPRKGPGEIWVGSPEVFTRERLVNDQLIQDAWLREKLSKESEETFGFQGIVDMRSFVGLSSRTGVEADPNLLAIYQAETQATLADMRREQQQQAQQSEIDRLQNLKTIRQLQKDLRAGEETSDSDVSNIALPTEAEGGGTDDGEAETPPEGETEPSSGETPSTEAPSNGPQPPSTGVDRTINFIDRLQADGRNDLLPDPASPETTDTKPSPIDEFRDRLAYREEIRNEIFENALDDRHDLRGNTAYRLNFDATILPKKKTDAWAVVEVQVSQAGPSETDSVAPSALERSCFETLDFYEIPRSVVQSEEDFFSAIDEAACYRNSKVDKIRLFWSAAQAARQRADRGTEPKLYFEQVRDTFLTKLAVATGDEDYLDLKELPSWDLVLLQLEPDCWEAWRVLEGACIDTVRADDDERRKLAASETLYRRWLRDFQQQARLLLVERWTRAKRCDLDDEGNLKQESGPEQCTGDFQLGHEIGSYAQNHLDLPVLMPGHQRIVIQPRPIIRPRPISQPVEPAIEPNPSEDSPWNVDYKPLEILDWNEVQPVVETVVGGVRSDGLQTVRFQGRDYVVTFREPSQIPGGNTQKDRVFLYADSETWNAFDPGRQDQVLALLKAIEDAFLWESQESVELGSNRVIMVSWASDSELANMLDGEVEISTAPALDAFDFGASGGWPTLFSAGERLEQGDIKELEVGGASLIVGKGLGQALEIYNTEDVVFMQERTPEAFVPFAQHIGFLDTGDLTPPGSRAEFRGPESTRKEPIEAKGQQGETIRFDVFKTDRQNFGPAERANKFFRAAIFAMAEECNVKHERALGILLIQHLQWTLSELQGLGKYLEFGSSKICDVDGLSIVGANSSSGMDSWEFKANLERFRQALDTRQQVYAFAATPKETVQRISEVAARRSTIEIAALLSALRPGAKVDNVTELVLDSQRILHGISRKPLVVGFTHGLHFPGKTLHAESSRVAHAGWLIGPKFSLTQAVWTWPWDKGFRYRHTPIQNNLSVAISVPAWWEDAEVAVTTYWRSSKNKTKGEARKHRHRIELPGTTAGITDALLEQRLPEVTEPEKYEVVHSKSARLLLIGRDLWRSTRVTLGGQVADKIIVLPALAGLVAEFEAVKELPSPDGKHARDGVPVRVWTSTGNRLAGEAKIYPAKSPKKVAPKLELTPPFFVKGKKLNLKLSQGDAPKGELQIQLLPYDDVHKTYGAPIVLGKPDFNAEAKTYSINVDNDALKADSLYRAVLVSTPQPGGKIETLNSEKLGVYYEQDPKITWSLEPSDGTVVIGGTLRIKLVAPARTAIAFPGFSAKTGLEIKNDKQAKIGSVRLKTTRWSEESRRFELESVLELVPAPGQEPVAPDDTILLLPVLADPTLANSLAMDPAEPRKIKFKSAS